MKKKSVLLIFFLCWIFAGAQTRFDRVDTIPVVVGGHTLQDAWAGGINFPLFSEIDLNGDGIHDLFMFDKLNNRLETFLNDGSASIHAWHYAPQYRSQFPFLNKWAILADYNCDGKPDLFTLSSLYPSGIAVYRNDTPPGAGAPLQWTLVNPFLQEHFSTIITNIFASAVSLPAFGDVDGDGDLDILGYNSVPDGRIVYHKNYSMEDYGNCDSLDFKYETGCWGNFALLIGGSNSVGCFNCPCRQRGPHQETDDTDLTQYNQSESARRDDTISSVFMFDADGNGVMDLLFGDISSSNTLLVHNGGTTSVALMDSQDVNYPSSNVPAYFSGFHYHAYIDLDNDGKKDLIVSAGENENQHGVWWYKNMSPNNVPDFQFQGTSFLQEEMIEAGENATPVLFDYDGDGLKDLMVGASTFQSASLTYKNSLYYYKNTGTSSNPAFELIDSDVAGISALNYSSPIYPAFGDMDGDGDEDMVIGLSDGTLQYFNNAGGPGNTANFLLALPNFMSIDVGNIATPQIIDVNRDGKPDMIVGEQNGFVNYFENIGTASSASFTPVPTNDTLGCIVRQMAGFTNGYTVPFMYDSLGKYRLLVSNMAGNIYEYSGIDGNLSGCFPLVDSLYDTVETNRIKFDITVSGGDLNGDGLTDLVVGQASGGVVVYYQHNPNSSVQEIPAVLSSMEIFPNPVNDRLLVRFYHPPAERPALTRIYDSQGKLLAQKELVADKFEFNTANLPPGIYLLQATIGNRELSGKFTVKH